MMTTRAQTYFLFAALIAALDAVLFESHFKLFMGLMIGTLMLGLLLELLCFGGEKEGSHSDRDSWPAHRGHRHSNDSDGLDTDVQRTTVGLPREGR